MSLFDVGTIDREVWDKIRIWCNCNIVGTERKGWTKIWIQYWWVLRVPRDRMGVPNY